MNFLIRHARPLVQKYPAESGEESIAAMLIGYAAQVIMLPTLGPRPNRAIATEYRKDRPFLYRVNTNVPEA
jgi:hypothetical protein